MATHRRGSPPKVPVPTRSATHVPPRRSREALMAAVRTKERFVPDSYQQPERPQVPSNHPPPLDLRRFRGNLASSTNELSRSGSSGSPTPTSRGSSLLSDYYEMSLDELVRGVDVGDVRALNESDKQISSIYSDVERGKEGGAHGLAGVPRRRLRRPWRSSPLVVAYGVLSGGLFVR